MWFQLLVTSSYLGVATSLVEKVVQAKRGTACERALLGIEVESAMAGIERVAIAMGNGQPSGEILPQAFMVRFATQRTIERAVMLAAELLGGMAFVGSPDLAYIIAASRALAYHPPSRTSMSDALAAYLASEPLNVL